MANTIEICLKKCSQIHVTMWLSIDDLINRSFESINTFLDAKVHKDHNCCPFKSNLHLSSFDKKKLEEEEDISLTCSVDPATLELLDWVGGWDLSLGLSFSCDISCILVLNWSKTKQTMKSHLLVSQIPQMIEIHMTQRFTRFVSNHAFVKAHKLESLAGYCRREEHNQFFQRHHTNARCIYS